MSKVLAIDLDGTLFYPSKKIKMIPKRNLTFLRDFIDAGNKVVLCSGRNKDYALKVQAKLKRPVDVIACNSAFIYCNNQIIKSSTINVPNIAQMVNDFSKEYNVRTWMVMTEQQSLIIAGELNWFKRMLYRFIYSLQGVYAEKYVISNEIFKEQLVNGDIYKIMLFFGLGKKGKMRAKEGTKALREKYGEYLEAFWSEYFMEITPVGISKAKGLEEYCKYNNIDHDDVYVIGDSGNDIPMFDEYYEHSFCMSHSHQSIQKHAKHVVDIVADLKKYFEGEQKNG